MSNQENKPEDLKNPVEEIENLKQKSSFRPKLRHILVMLFLGIVISGAAARTWQISNKPKTIEPIAQDPNSPIKLFDNNGYPLLNPPAPADAEVWECEVAIVGGSLGGVAAAYHSMKTGATTCLIELTPMLGGQVSSQGVSAIDESLLMRYRQKFPLSWTHFKNIIASQPATRKIFLLKARGSCSGYQ
jgi:NADPH-dependent 2,4-dienoyl-CoA reductase/sulfur reductase-like enzyme